VTNPSTAKVSWPEQTWYLGSYDSFKQFFYAGPLYLHWPSLSTLALSSVVSSMIFGGLPAWVPLMVCSLVLTAP